MLHCNMAQVQTIARPVQALQRRPVARVARRGRNGPPMAGRAARLPPCAPAHRPGAAACPMAGCIEAESPKPLNPATRPWLVHAV
jgi:hypothetical protein